MRSLAAVATLLAGVVLFAAGPAYADTTARGPGGQRLTVSKTSGLDRAGETVTVSGAGYDVDKGIYVAYCVDNGAGAVPTPCGGGADMSGSLGASHWISSNPPSYGEGLAVPYGAGGSFRVRVKVTTKIGDVDCTARRCSVVTRTDHTRTSDRTQDVRIPVTFAGAAGGGTRTTAPAAKPPAPERTTAAPPRTNTSAPATSAPAGAAPVVTGAPQGTAAAPATDAPLAVTRVSDSTSAGRWWTGTVAVLGALVLVLLLMLWRRGRRA
ncbi:hypothetical protein [Phytohabitans kaempferiae]|uniref:MYXO-CTERM domain-containing protein n=1 Tax=Phytohabitans kaempferiae TaxID=1620943 RepID=A0ABV6MAV1_9ACTN